MSLHQKQDYDDKCQVHILRKRLLCDILDRIQATTNKKDIA